MDDVLERVVGVGEEDRICESGDGVGTTTTAVGDDGDGVKVDEGPKGRRRGGGGGGGEEEEEEEEEEEDDDDDDDTAGTVDGRGSAKKMSSSRSWSRHRPRSRSQVWSRPRPSEADMPMTAAALPPRGREADGPGE